MECSYYIKAITTQILLSSTVNSLLLKMSSKRCFKSNGLNSSSFSVPSSTAGVWKKKKNDITVQSLCLNVLLNKKLDIILADKGTWGSPKSLLKTVICLCVNCSAPLVLRTTQMQLRIWSTNVNKIVLYTAQRSWHSEWVLSSAVASHWTGLALTGWTWPGRLGSLGSVTRHCGPHRTHRWCSGAAHLMFEACTESE